MSDLSQCKNEKELNLFNPLPVAVMNNTCENVEVIEKTEKENKSANMDETNSKFENSLEPKYGTECNCNGKPHLPQIVINNLLEIHGKLSTVSTAADQESSTISPGNTNEAIEISQRNLQKSLDLLNKWDPVLLLTFGKFYNYSKYKN